MLCPEMTRAASQLDRGGWVGTAAIAGFLHALSRLPGVMDGPFAMLHHIPKAADIHEAHEAFRAGDADGGTDTTLRLLRGIVNVSDDVLLRKSIFLVVNNTGGSHWVIYMIRIGVYSKQPGGNGASIVMLDSMRTMPTSVDEARAAITGDDRLVCRLGQVLQATHVGARRLWTPKFVVAACPQQKDGSSCGVAVCHQAACVVKTGAFDLRSAETPFGTPMDASDGDTDAELRLQANIQRMRLRLLVAIMLSAQALNAPSHQDAIRVEAAVDVLRRKAERVALST
jgi:hypothetical protein